MLKKITQNDSTLIVVQQRLRSLVSSNFIFVMRMPMMSIGSQIIPEFQIHNEMQRLVADQWCEFSQNSDAYREQLIIDHDKREVILQLFNRIYKFADFPSLIQDIDSNNVMRQLRGVIGLRILLGSIPQLIVHHFLKTNRLQELLEMAVTKGKPQLQLEVLRFLNCLATKGHFVTQLKEKDFQAVIDILALMLIDKNIEVLSRTILILANLCKATHLYRQFKLVRVSEEHSNSKIKLQCCWALVNICKKYYKETQIPPKYELIAAQLCKMLMGDLLTFKPLFYLSCKALQRSQATNCIIQYRVYEKVLTIDIRTDTTLFNPVLTILFLAVHKVKEINSTLFENETCDFLVQCLPIAKIQSMCFLIIGLLLRCSKSRESVLKHQKLLSKIVQLFSSDQIPIKLLQIDMIPTPLPLRLIEVFDFMVRVGGKQILIRSENKLICSGIIKTLVSIMAANPGVQYISNRVLNVLRCLLKSQQQFRKTSFYAYLFKLQGVRIFQQTQGKTLDKILYPNIQRKIQSSKAPQRQGKSLDKILYSNIQRKIKSTKTSLRKRQGKTLNKILYPNIKPKIKSSKAPLRKPK